MIHGTNKRNIEEGVRMAEEEDVGLTSCHKHIKKYYIYTWEISYRKPTGNWQISPIQPGLQDSHGIGKDRQKTAGGDLYSWGRLRGKGRS